MFEVVIKLSKNWFNEFLNFFLFRSVLLSPSHRDALGCPLPSSRPVVRNRPVAFRPNRFQQTKFQQNHWLMTMNVLLEFIWFNSDLYLISDFWVRLPANNVIKKKLKDKRIRQIEKLCKLNKIKNYMWMMNVLM